VKGINKLHTQVKFGLCKLGNGQVAMYAETPDATYVYPVQKVTEPGLPEVMDYLRMKFGAAVMERFMSTRPDISLFFSEDDELLRDELVDTVYQALPNLD